MNDLNKLILIGTGIVGSFVFGYGFKSLYDSIGKSNCTYTKTIHMGASSQDSGINSTANSRQQTEVWTAEGLCDYGFKELRDAG